MENVIILAGGQGKRMHADLPKPMFPVLGEPMLRWVIRACESAELNRICVVTGYRSEIIEEFLGDRFRTALQSERLGTGHAVMQAVPFLKENLSGNTLVLCGDAPFVDAETIRSSLKAHIENQNAVTVISSEIECPTGYGRIVRSDSGKPDAIACIVEEKDATPLQRAIKEINSGIYWFQTEALLDALTKIQPNNKQGEYYLTDTIQILMQDGKAAGAYLAENPDVVLGANDRMGLLRLNTIARERVIEKHLNQGVSFLCTDGIIIERDVVIGSGTEILPGTILRGHTVIGKDCVIGPNSVAEDCTIGDGVKLNCAQAYQSTIENGVHIGPFVHIRPNTVIRSGAKIGDFVELKNSNIGEGTSIAHLSYVGDSDIGKKVNLGCGTVTVNYDGIVKSRCEIGDHSFIGCNTNLIAPVKLGKSVYTAAGTSITQDIPDYALAIDRGTLKIKDGYTLRKFSKTKNTSSESK